MSKEKSEPASVQPSEFERFTQALRKIVSVRKSDLDLHKPIKPRRLSKPKPAAS